MPWVKQKVVVPLDFSDDAFAAVDVAREIAATADQVHLVHVLPDLVPVDPSDDAWQTLTDESRIKQALLDLNERLPDEGNAERFATLDAHDGVYACSFANECSQVCPKHVDPAMAIQQAKLNDFLQWAKILPKKSFA